MRKEVNRKFLMFSLVLLVSISILGVSVSAIEWGKVTGFWTFLNWLTNSTAPTGYENSNAGVALGIIALVMIFVILLDVLQLVLPFSEWVSWVLAIGFTIAMMIIGLVRSIAGWGLTIAAIIVGGTGTFAIIMVSIIFLLAIIALFFGGEKIAGWLKMMKMRRKTLDKISKSEGAAGDIRAF